jgi:hypothetical protein
LPATRAAIAVPGPRAAAIVPAATGPAVTLSVPVVIVSIPVPTIAWTTRQNQRGDTDERATTYETTHLGLLSGRRAR